VNGAMRRSTAVDSTPSGNPPFAAFAVAPANAHVRAVSAPTVVRRNARLLADSEPSRAAW
jgi:hypothetical protein